jgi:hypothetical protein
MTKRPHPKVGALSCAVTWPYGLSSTLSQDLGPVGVSVYP